MIVNKLLLKLLCFQTTSTVIQDQKSHLIHQYNLKISLVLILLYLFRDINKLELSNCRMMICLFFRQLINRKRNGKLKFRTKRKCLLGLGMAGI